MNEIAKSQEIKQIIEEHFSFLKTGIQYSKIYNTGLVFDTGTFGELLTCALFDCHGAGTQGGSSFDTSRGDEVKTLLYIQSKKCNSCDYKNSFFMKNCIKCNSSDFTFSKDTRAGIDSVSHIKYYELLNDYIIHTIEPATYSEECNEFHINSYIIKKDNVFFNELLKIQYSHGKHKTKNLLPTSIEFYMCSPSKFFSAIVNLEQDISCDIKHICSSYKEENVCLIPRKLFTRKYKKYKDKIAENYNPIKNTLGIVPEVGTHGKKRGLVVRKNLFEGTTNYA